MVEDLAVAEEVMAAREATMTWGWECTVTDPHIVTEAGAGVMEEGGTEEVRHPETGFETSRSVVKCKLTFDI